MEYDIQHTAEINDIEFNATPTGFVLGASLSTYWSLPTIIFLIIWTSGFAYGFVQDWSNINIVLRIVGVLFVSCISGVFWWMALLQAFGTQSIIVNQPYLDIKVGIGFLAFKYHFETHDIISVAEGDGIFSRGEFGSPYKAVILGFRSPISERLSVRTKFSFGHFLTPTQRRFIINRLHETLRIAA